MVFRRWLLVGLLVAMAVLAGSGPALAAGGADEAAADTAQEIETPGTATLVKCRDWLVMESCRSYDRIVIPTAVRLNDRFRVRFGSNPKSFEFRVGQIARSGDGCRVIAAVNWVEQIELSGDKLDITPCRILR